jgi:hypothetical protein
VGWLNWLFVDLSRIGADGLVFVVAGAVLAFFWRHPWLFVVGADGRSRRRRPVLRAAAVDRP